MSTIRIGNRDVRASQDLLNRLKKTPKSQVKTVREQILQWAKKGGASGPKVPKPPKPPTRPTDSTPGKASRRTYRSQKPFTAIPAHVLFRKQYPIDKR
jgi:hypothetical protein